MNAPLFRFLAAFLFLFGSFAFGAQGDPVIKIVSSLPRTGSARAAPICAPPRKCFSWRRRPFSITPVPNAATPPAAGSAAVPAVALGIR